MEKNSAKMPKFFLIMLSILALIMLIGMFVNFFVAGTAYFVVLILAVVLFVMSKSSKRNFTNFKLTYFMFDFLNLIAIISIIYYEWSKQSITLNVLLICLLAFFVILIIVDIFLLNEKFENKKVDTLICTSIVATNVCILTYFYNVSDFWFSVAALVFSLISIISKIAFSVSLKIKKAEGEDISENALETRIQSSEEHEGEIEE